MQEWGALLRQAMGNAEGHRKHQPAPVPKPFPAARGELGRRPLEPRRGEVLVRGAAEPPQQGVQIHPNPREPQRSDRSAQPLRARGALLPALRRSRGGQAPWGTVLQTSRAAKEKQKPSHCLTVTKLQIKQVGTCWCQAGPSCGVTLSSPPQPSAFELYPQGQMHFSKSPGKAQ